MEGQRQDNFVISEIIDSARGFARNVAYLNRVGEPEDPRFIQIMVEWRIFQNTLSPIDLKTAICEFRRVLGEE